MPSDEEAREGAPWWAIALAIVAVLVWWGADAPRFFTSIMPSIRMTVDGTNAAAGYGGAVGDILGSSIVKSAVVSAILFFVFVRERTLERYLQYFGILWAIVVVVDIGSVAFVGYVGSGAAAQNAQWAIATSEIRRTEMQAAGLAPGSIETRSKATGEAGIVEGKIKSIVARMESNKDSYRADLKELGYPDFLKPAQLARNGGLRFAHAQLAKARQLVAKYKALDDQTVIDLRRAIETSISDPYRRQQQLTGFDGQFAQHNPERKHLWEDEVAVIDAFDQRVTILMRSHWRPVGNTFVFSSQTDLDAFRTNSTDIQSLIADEKSTRDQMNADLTSVPTIATETGSSPQ